VHAEWLAKASYNVHLIDPVPLHVSQAEQLDGVTASLGDARELGIATATVDAALLLGPLYHLVIRAERHAALAEALRVTRSGGVVAVAAISRFASMRDSLRKGWVDDPEWIKTVERTVQTGQHVNSAVREGRFTTAYFHRPDDLRNELIEVGLEDVQVYAVEGPGSFLHNLDELLDSPQHRDVLMRWIELVEREPALVGASSHIMAVGRVPPAR
jgi:ubiquinone/menaquinone biosynthesis C-methylase UbiE